MKVLTAIFLLALVIGVVPVFASEVSAADQTNNPLIVKENVSENISDLNVAAKPDAAVNVENSTAVEPAKTDTTGIASVQNTSNSTEIGKDANSTNLKSGDSRELTVEEMKSIKGKGWGEDLLNFGKAILDKITDPFRWTITGNNSDVEYYPDGKVKRNRTSNLQSNISFPIIHAKKVTKKTTKKKSSKR